MVPCNGITWDWVEHTITIDQCTYVQKILARFGLHNLKPVSTLMATNLKLPKLDASIMDQWLHQLMLGSLMYVAVGTCPDIMYAMLEWMWWNCNDQFPP